MAKRKQVADLNQAPAIQPAAQQVNLFHSPLTALPAEDNKALELSRALGIMVPALGQSADIAVDKEVKQGEEAALLAQRTENRDKITGAVKAGALPAGASPWFQKGWARQKNRILADQYASDLKQAYAKWGGKDSDNPEESDVQSFMEGHLQEFIKNRQVNTNDPEFRNVFAGMAAQIQSQQSAEHSAHRVNLIERQVVENTGAEIAGILDAHYVYGTDEHVSDVIGSVLAEHVKNGADGSTLNKAAVDAITQKAILDDNPELLKHLDRIQTGSGRLGRTLYARDERLKAENHLYTQRNAKLSSEWSESERAKKLAGEAIFSDAIKRLKDDPNADVSDLFTDSADTDPDVGPKILSLQGAVQAASRNKTPSLVDAANTYQHIYEGTFTHRNLANLIIEANAAHRPLSQEQIKDYSIAIEKAQQANQHGGILRDPLYNDTQDRIKRGITSSNAFHTDREADLRAVTADTLFARYMIEFTTQDPRPSPKQIQDEMFRLETELINKYKSQKDKPFVVDPLETLKAHEATQPGQQKQVKPQGHELGDH